MTIEALKKQVVAAVAPLEAIVGKRGDYGRVQISLSDGCEIAGFFGTYSMALAKISDVEEFAVPDTVTELGYALFKYHTSLKRVVLPENITTIRGDMFYGCTSLTEVVLPTKLTKINSDAFHGCINLETINLPAALEEISQEAFAFCARLRKPGVDAKVKVGEHAFVGCIE